MTTTVTSPRDTPKSTTDLTRFLGTVISEPEEKVSQSGNEYTRMRLVANNGTPGGDVFWSVTIMKKLKDKLPQDLFKKFAYAKWIGSAQSNEYTKKNGEKAIGWNMLVNAVELQNGEYISAKDKTEDEDAPF